MVAFDGSMQREPTVAAADLWFFRGVVALTALLVLVGRVGSAPRGLVAATRRGVGPLGQLTGFGLIFSLAGFRWRGPEIDALLLGGGAAALAGMLHLALAAVVVRWPGGILQRSERGPYLQGRDCRYLLGDWPGDCAEGETLWLPALELKASGDGPYRRGRPLGRSPWVVRDTDGRLVQRLVRQGVLLEAWALLTLSWVALSTYG